MDTDGCQCPVFVSRFGELKSLQIQLYHSFPARIAPKCVHTRLVVFGTCFGYVRSWRRWGDHDPVRSVAPGGLNAYRAFESQRGGLKDGLHAGAEVVADGKVERGGEAGSCCEGCEGCTCAGGEDLSMKQLFSVVPYSVKCMHG